MNSWAIEIDRADITSAELVEEKLDPIPGQCVLRLDSFALTANNVTYALYGPPSGLFGNDQGYWDFFSSHGTAGRLPVWGFGTVIETTVPGVASGDRYYGYYPLAQHAVLTPGHVAADRFVDVEPARTTLPAVYNQYQNIDRLTDYRAADHEYWPIFRPLYLTSWLLADQLACDAEYDARRLLITSASSKTAVGLAHALRQLSGKRHTLVGVTGAEHKSSIMKLNLYDEVIAYTELAKLDSTTPTNLIDVAGNPGITQRIHELLVPELSRSIAVGNSHWRAFGKSATLPGPKIERFFAPTRSQKRAIDWGEKGIRDKIEQAWLSFMKIAPSLVQVEKRHGPIAALATYREVVQGATHPGIGILNLS